VQYRCARRFMTGVLPDPWHGHRQFELQSCMVTNNSSSHHAWRQTIRAPIMHGHKQFEHPSCMDTNNSSTHHAWTQTIRAAIMHSMKHIAIPACGYNVDTKSSSPKHAWHGMHRHIHTRDTHMHLQVSGVIDTHANCACRQK
jgi:hypothetical protein